jgi:predicted ester cyclase
MSRPLEIYEAYQQRLQGQDYAHLGEVVDLQGYTENCLGLTGGWTTGFEVALGNYARNILAAFTDMQVTTEDVVEGINGLAIRSRIVATHTGTFLGQKATHRQVAWDMVAIVHTQDGRVVGQWIQPDLWGIYQQLTSASASAPPTAAAKPELAWAHSAR